MTRERGLNLQISIFHNLEICQFCGSITKWPARLPVDKRLVRPFTVPFLQFVAYVEQDTQRIFCQIQTQPRIPSVRRLNRRVDQETKIVACNRHRGWSNELTHGQVRHPRLGTFSAKRK